MLQILMVRLVVLFLEQKLRVDQHFKLLVHLLLHLPKLIAILQGLALILALMKMAKVSMMNLPIQEQLILLETSARL